MKKYYPNRKCQTHFLQMQMDFKHKQFIYGNLILEKDRKLIFWQCYLVVKLLNYYSATV